jgi:hypothetical protein
MMNEKDALVQDTLRVERQRVYDRLYALPMDEAERQRVLNQLRPEMVVAIDARIMACAEYFIDNNSVILNKRPREEMVSELARILANDVDAYVGRNSPTGRLKQQTRMGHYLDCPRSRTPFRGECICRVRT